MVLPVWFYASASILAIGIRAIGFLFGPREIQSGWKMADTNALVFALLTIAAAIIEAQAPS